MFYKIVINENKRTMGYPEFIKTKKKGALAMNGMLKTPRLEIGAGHMRRYLVK